MYVKEKQIGLKSSASLISNNLSLQIKPDHSGIVYSIIHKSSVNIVTVTSDGKAVAQRQISCKDPSATSYTDTKNFVIQSRWLSLSNRSIFVLAALNGVQMYESDGCTMLYWQSLDKLEKQESGEGSSSTFARGICGLGKSTICVGTSAGQIFVYSVPQKGYKVVHKLTVSGHEGAISDLASNDLTLVSGDDVGALTVWRFSETSGKLQKHLDIKTNGYSPCTGLVIWRDTIAAGYGDGYLRLFNARNGLLGAEVAAHARWIHAVDVAAETGQILTASEDSFVRIWSLADGELPQIQHVHNECVPDTQVVGAVFTQPDGGGFCVTGYDSTDLTFYRRA